MARPPSTPFRTIEHQRLRAAGLCAALKQRFAELLSRDFPDDGASEALTLLEELLTIVQGRVAVLSDEPTLAMTGQVVLALGLTLEYFDNAGTDQTPRGLVCLLRSLYRRLNRRSKLLAWPQADYNFTIRSLVDFLKTLFQHLGPNAEIDAVFAKYSGPHDLVSFPRVERDNVCMFAIFGHELGHSIADQFLVNDALTTAYKAREAQARQEVVQALGVGVTFSKLQAAMANVFNLRKRALQELISDTVGVYLFGLSALFACHEICDDLDMMPSSDNLGYPPGRMRIRVSLEASRAETHLNTLDALAATQGVDPAFLSSLSLVDRLEAIATDDADTRAIAAEPMVKIAYEWVFATLPLAQAFAKQEIGTALYAAQTMAVEVPRLVERLKDGLPPNEIGNSLQPTYVDERSSVLAAWIVLLGVSQAAAGTNTPPAELNHLNERTLLGLEYVELQSKYRAIHPRPTP